MVECPSVAWDRHERSQEQACEVCGIEAGACACPACPTCGTILAKPAAPVDPRPDGICKEHGPYGWNERCPVCAPVDHSDGKMSLRQLASDIRTLANRVTQPEHHRILLKLADHAEIAAYHFRPAAPVAPAAGEDVAMDAVLDRLVHIGWPTPFPRHKMVEDLAYAFAAAPPATVKGEPCSHEWTDVARCLRCGITYDMVDADKPVAAGEPARESEAEEAAQLCQRIIDLPGIYPTCLRDGDLLRLASAALRRGVMTELPVDCPPDVAMAILEANVAHDKEFPNDGIKRSQRIWSAMRAALRAALREG